MTSASSALFVHGFECFGDVFGNPKGFLDWNAAAANPFGERLAFNQFQRKCMDAIGFFEAVDGRNVRVIQRGQQSRLALEPRATIGVCSKRSRSGFSAQRRGPTSCRAHDTPRPSRRRPQPRDLVAAYMCAHGHE